MVFIILLWFFNFFTHAYLIRVSVSNNLVNSRYIGGFRYQGYVSQNSYKYDVDVQYGSNYQCGCGRNVSIENVTRPFSLGEEPFWSVRTKSIYFVDASGSAICQYSVHTGELFCVKLGSELVSNVIPILNIPNKYFSSYGSNLTIVTWNGTSNTATFESIGQPDPNPNNFVDDSKPDSRGVVFLWTDPVILSIDAIPPNRSQLHNIVNGKLTTLLTGFNFGNGLAFSLDGSFIYFSDTKTNRTYKSCYDRATNSIKYTRVIIDYSEKGITCSPDSLTIDKKGYLWVACAAGGQILKLDPNTGYVVCSIKLPASAPTNLAFAECPGMENDVLDCLFITTAGSLVKSHTPYDGALLLVRNIGSEGLPPNEVVFNQLINEPACRENDR